MKRGDLLLAAGLAAAFAALVLPMAPLGVDPHHDGAMLKPAMDVRAGQVLFRDTFMQYGGLTVYLQALALWFEPRLLALRWQAVAAGALSLALLYAAWRSVLPRPLAVVAGMCFILSIPVYEKDPWNAEYWIMLPWSSALALLFQSFGVLALTQVIRGLEAGRWALVLGAATAGVVWCRQPVGVTMAGSLVLVAAGLHLSGWRPEAGAPRGVWLRALGGFLAVNAAMLGGIALGGALPDWWYQNVLWPARWSQAMVWMDTLPLVTDPAAAAGLLAWWLALLGPGWLACHRPELTARLAPAWFVALAGVTAWQHEWFLGAIQVGQGAWNILVPLAAMVLAVASLVRLAAGRGRPFTTEYHLIAALAAVGLASVTQYYPMADTWHIFYGLGPVFGLLVFGLWRWSGWPAERMAVLLALLLLPSAVAKIRAIGPALERPLVTLAEPAVLRGMRVPPAQALAFRQVDAVLAAVMRHAPDQPAALIGNNALYLCFLKNLANPLPYYVTWRGLATPEHNLRRWEYIRRVRPLLILQEARWEAVDGFYREQHYVPLLFVPAELIEIAVPQELAEAMGVKAYGLDGRPRPAHVPAR